MAAPVVRDRLIANGSRSGDPALQSGVCMAVGETSRSRCAFGETDVGEGQALALRYIKVLRTFSPCDSCASIDIKVLTDLKASFFCASSL